MAPAALGFQYSQLSRRKKRLLPALPAFYCWSDSTGTISPPLLLIKHTAESVQLWIYPSTARFTTNSIDDRNFARENDGVLLFKPICLFSIYTFSNWLVLQLDASTHHTPCNEHSRDTQTLLLQL